jgi:uncharacterized protein HemY
MIERFRRRFLFGLGLIMVCGSVLAWYLRPDPQWAAAEQALAHHDYATAYNLLHDCLARRPDDAQLLFLAGADLKRLGQLTKEVLRQPHDPALRCEVGILFLRNGEEQEGVRWLHLAITPPSAD